MGKYRVVFGNYCDSDYRPLPYRIQRKRWFGWWRTGYGSRTYEDAKEIVDKMNQEVCRELNKELV